MRRYCDATLGTVQYVPVSPPAASPPCVYGTVVRVPYGDIILARMIRDAMACASSILLVGPSHDPLYSTVPYEYGKVLWNLDYIGQIGNVQI